jgi:peroxiredoxin
MDQEPLNIKPGDPLPPFRLTAQCPDGHTEEVDSSALKQPLVLFFYPEADTPG